MIKLSLISKTERAKTSNGVDFAMRTSTREYVLKLTSLLVCLAAAFLSLTGLSYQSLLAWKALPNEGLDKQDAFRSVFFVNGREGWIAGSNATLMHTSDGGNRWLSRSPRLRWWSFSSLYFADLNKGWVCGGEEVAAVLATGDGGNTWTRQYRGDPGHLNCLVGKGENCIWAVGEGGQIVTTIDGTNWARRPTGIKACLTGIDMYNSKTGWAVGCDGIILKTDDGGLHWQEQKSGVSVKLTSIAAVNDAKVFVTGSNGKLLQTIDGGKTWNQKDIDTLGDLNHVRFPSSELGWIVGGNGIMFATTDGGQNWVRMKNIVNVDLIDLYFVQSDLGWAVGRDGAVLKYSR